MVPSCSPFVVTDEEKPAIHPQQQLKSQEKAIMGNIHKENIVPLDEKSPLFQSKEEKKIPGSKRQPRTIDHVTNVKPINFLKDDDDIFD